MFFTKDKPTGSTSLANKLIGSAFTQVRKHKRAFWGSQEELYAVVSSMLNVITEEDAEKHLSKIPSCLFGLSAKEFIYNAKPIGKEFNYFIYVCGRYNIELDKATYKEYFNSEEMLATLISKPSDGVAVVIHKNNYKKCYRMCRVGCSVYIIEKGEDGGDIFYKDTNSVWKSVNCTSNYDKLPNYAGILNDCSCTTTSKIFVEKEGRMFLNSYRRKIHKEFKGAPTEGHFSTILKTINNVANGDQKLVEALFQWLHHAYFTPAKPIPMLYLASKLKGSAKSTFALIAQEMFGASNTAAFNDLSEIKADKFTPGVEKNLIILDDVSGEANNKQRAWLKSAIANIGAVVQKVERKGEDPYFQEAYFKLIVTTNEETNCFGLEDTDFGRILPLCPNEVIASPIPINEMKAKINDELPAFIAYLKSIPLSPSNTRFGFDSVYDHPQVVAVRNRLLKASESGNEVSDYLEDLVFNVAKNYEAFKLKGVVRRDGSIAVTAKDVLRGLNEQGIKRVNREQILTEFRRQNFHYVSTCNVKTVVLNAQGKTDVTPLAAKAKAYLIPANMLTAELEALEPQVANDADTQPQPVVREPKPKKVKTVSIAAVESVDTSMTQPVVETAVVNKTQPVVGNNADSIQTIGMLLNKMLPVTIDNSAQSQPVTETAFLVEPPPVITETALPPVEQFVAQEPTEALDEAGLPPDCWGLFGDYIYQCLPVEWTQFDDIEGLDAVVHYRNNEGFPISFGVTMAYANDIHSPIRIEPLKLYDALKSRDWAGTELFCFVGADTLAICDPKFVKTRQIPNSPLVEVDLLNSRPYLLTRLEDGRYIQMDGS